MLLYIFKTMVIFLSVNFQRFLVDCQDDRILLSLIKRVEKIRFLCLTHCIVLHKTIINWLFFNKRKLVLQRQIWTQPSALFVCIVIVKRAIIFNFVYIILSVGRAQPKETRLNNNLILIKASPLLIQFICQIYWHHFYAKQLEDLCNPPPAKKFVHTVF